MQEGILSRWMFRCAKNAQTLKSSGLSFDCHHGSRRSNRGQWVHMLFSYLCSALGIDVHVNSEEDRNVVVWVLVCRGHSQYARHIIGRDKEKREEQDHVPIPEVVQAQQTLHTPTTRGKRRATSRRNTTQSQSQTTTNLHASIRPMRSNRGQAIVRQRKRISVPHGKGADPNAKQQSQEKEDSTSQKEKLPPRRRCLVVARSSVPMMKSVCQTLITKTRKKLDCGSVSRHLSSNVRGFATMKQTHTHTFSIRAIQGHCTRPVCEPALFAACVRSSCSHYRDLPRGWCEQKIHRDRRTPCSRSRLADRTATVRN